MIPSLWVLALGQGAIPSAKAATRLTMMRQPCFAPWCPLPLQGSLALCAQGPVGSFYPLPVCAGLGPGGHPKCEGRHEIDNDEAALLRTMVSLASARVPRSMCARSSLFFCIPSLCALALDQGPPCHFLRIAWRNCNPKCEGRHEIGNDEAALLRTVVPLASARVPRSMCARSSRFF